jgi:hypothetical protein
MDRKTEEILALLQEKQDARSASDGPTHMEFSSYFVEVSTVIQSLLDIGIEVAIAHAVEIWLKRKSDEDVHRNDPEEFK